MHEESHHTTSRAVKELPIHAAVAAALVETPKLGFVNWASEQTSLERVSEGKRLAYNFRIAKVGDIYATSAC